MATIAKPSSGTWQAVIRKMSCLPAQVFVHDALLEAQKAFQPAIATHAELLVI